MINMLIVDDEIIMRKGLSCIPWERAGVKVVGIASSGTEALSMIQEMSVHILFTDIQMPDISGLELIRAATRLNPSIRSILLTGHSNFNYAKEAISLQVYDYILKPCDPEEVLHTIGKLAAEIESEQNARLEYHKQISQLSQYNAESILLRLFSTQRITPDELRLLQAPPCCLRSDDLFTIAILLCAKKEWIHAAVQQKFSDRPPFILTDSSDHTILLFHNPPSGISCRQQISDFLHQLSESLQQESRPKISLGVTADSLSDLPESYSTARISAGLFFSHPDDSFLDYQEIADKLNACHPADIRQKIILGIQQKNYMAIRTLMKELTDFYRVHWISLPQLRLDMVDLCLTASNITAQKEKDLITGLSAGQLLAINSADTLEDLIQVVLTLITSCIDSLNHSSGNQMQQYLTDCMKFIHEHYTEDINLACAADVLHMNSDYLGRMLKKEFGQPFNQLLTRVRLEKACTLLADINIPISEVAVQTGFRDFRSFGQLFKSHYHQTPSEYRKALRRKGTQV